MALNKDEELELLNIEIALREKEGQAKSSPVASAVAQGASSIPGVGPMGALANRLTQASPEAQRAVLTTAGAEAGLPFGVAASGAGAAAGGAVAEAAQNPATAARVLSPMAKTLLAPTPESVLQTIQQVTSPEAKEFGKRRALEAGTAAAGGTILKGIRGVKAEGPLSAGIETPSLAFGKVRAKILNELGMAKTAARKGEDVAEASRLRRMLAIGQAGKVKLSEEAIDAVNTGKKLSNTQLLAYEEALGKIQTKGGALSGDYEVARKAIRSRLKEQSPILLEKKALARKLFISEGKGETEVSLIGALTNPTKAAALPGVQRAIGAGTRVAAEGLFPGFVASSDLLSNTLQQLSAKRKAGRK